MSKIFYNKAHTAERLGISEAGVTEMSQEGRLQRYRDGTVQIEPTGKRDQHELPQVNTHSDDFNGFI